VKRILQKRVATHLTELNPFKCHCTVNCTYGLQTGSQEFKFKVQISLILKILS